MTTSFSLSLAQMGWSPFFQQQLSLQEWEEATIARVIARHRHSVDVMTMETAKLSVSISPSTPKMAVGDWVLLDSNGGFQRLLERTSLFDSETVSNKSDEAKIAANIDTVFVVCSLGDEFELERIKRYLTLVREADAEPVVLLTKADRCDNVEDFIEKVRKIDKSLFIEAINAKDEQSFVMLKPWCKVGKTVALLGAPKAGKSALCKGLIGDVEQPPFGAAGDDATLYMLTAGGWLLDTPKMRELQLVDSDFDNSDGHNQIQQYARKCRFSDCRHIKEPGCAVLAAVESGKLDGRRVQSYVRFSRDNNRDGAPAPKKHSHRAGLTDIKRREE